MAYIWEEGSYEGHPTFCVKEIYVDRSGENKERIIFRAGYRKWKALMDNDVMAAAEEFVRDCEEKRSAE